VSSLNLTESEVLAKVWNATHVVGDPNETGLRREMLVKRLAEGWEEGSCTSGRVARVVDSLSTFDQRVNLRPAWAIRQELLGRASVLAQQEHDRPLKEVLQETFTKEYVDTGLVPDYLLKAELEDWGDHV
jgi:hypothetical protein